jgi:hypothetical protein
VLAACGDKYAQRKTEVSEACIVSIRRKTFDMKQRARALKSMMVEEWVGDGKGTGLKEIAA